MERMMKVTPLTEPHSIFDKPRWLINPARFVIDSGKLDFFKNTDKFVVTYRKYISDKNTYVYSKDTGKIYIYVNGNLKRITDESYCYAQRHVWVTFSTSCAYELVKHLQNISRWKDVAFDHTSLKTYPSEALFKSSGVVMKPEEFQYVLKDIIRKEHIITKRIGFTKYDIESLGIVEHDSFLTFSNVGNTDKFYSHLADACENPSQYSNTTLFHGTSHQAALEICRNGFRASRRGALGRGVYVGNFDKALTFASSRDNTKYIQNVVLEVDILFKDLKKIKDMADATIENDNHYEGFARPEWVIRDESRLIVKKLHYK